MPAPVLGIAKFTSVLSATFRIDTFPLAGALDALAHRHYEHSTH
jgi:hypothetical protein